MASMSLARPRRRRPSVARDRLLDTAGEIFYAEGIHSVGVDRVIERAHVTRATFYRHFPGKEDLVRACLEARDQGIRRRLGALCATEASAPERLRAVVRAIGDQLVSDGFRGCAFINAAAEYPDPASPVHQAVLAQRRWMHALLAELLEAAGHAEPAYGARTLLMLRDGAMVSGDLDDPAATRESLTRAAESLIATV
jgi:AcrR family transcriptional regulator